MGGFRAVEDRPTPKEVYNWRLYSECIIIATGSLLFGYDSAFVGTTIARDSFVSRFGINDNNSSSVSSNITSAFQAGAFFGALFCFFTTERLGRKWTLEAYVVVFVIGAVLMVATTGNLGMIYAGRVLTGIGCGAITATVPSYLAELSIPSIRGILTGFFEVAYQLGSLVGFWINYGIDQNASLSSPNNDASWRIPMAVQLIPSCALLVSGLLLHESPLWLMRNDRRSDAISALTSLRRLPADHPYILEDVAALDCRLREEAAVANQSSPGTSTSSKLSFYLGALRSLSRRGMRNRVALVFCAFALQNLSGAAAINYYSPTLFSSLGVTDVSLYTGIYGLVKAVASIIYYVFFVDMLGRRRPSIVSSLACSACLWFVGAYVKIGHPAQVLDSGVGQLSQSTVQGGKAAIAMIMIYSVFWSFGLNGIPWIVSAEIFPGALRNFSGTFTAMVQWLTQFAITKALPYIFESFGYGTWFFFASWLLIAGTWAFFFLPETKGLTVDQMDIIFGYNDEFTSTAQQAQIQPPRIPHTSFTTMLSKQHREEVDDAVAYAQTSKAGGGFDNNAEHAENV